MLAKSVKGNSNSKRGNIIFNSSELYENKDAGNVDLTYRYSDKYQFNLYGGYIEIKTKKIPKIILKK